MGGGNIVEIVVDLYSLVRKVGVYLKRVFCVTLNNTAN